MINPEKLEIGIILISDHPDLVIQKVIRVNGGWKVLSTYKGHENGYLGIGKIVGSYYFNSSYSIASEYIIDKVLNKYQDEV